MVASWWCSRKNQITTITKVCRIQHLGTVNISQKFHDDTVHPTDVEVVQPTGRLTLPYTSLGWLKKSMNILVYIFIIESYFTIISLVCPLKKYSSLAPLR